MTDTTPDQLAEAVEALTLVRLTPTATFEDLPQEVGEALTLVRQTPTAAFASLPEELREALTDVRLAPAATFADLPRELREKIYSYAYTCSASDDKEWLPRTTFAVNKQYYSEARNILLQQVPFTRVTVNLKPEMIFKLLGSKHAEGWIQQEHPAGPVTNFKQYHMHIVIGPTNKSKWQPMHFMLVDSWRLQDFCARLAVFKPRRANEAYVNVRRLRIRIECQQPLTSAFHNIQQQFNLFDALKEFWWSFEDIQIKDAIKEDEADADPGRETQRALSRVRWATEDAFVGFLTLFNEQAWDAITAGELTQALVGLVHKQTLVNVISLTPQHNGWRAGMPGRRARLLRYEDDLLSTLLRLEIRLRIAQQTVSADTYATSFRAEIQAADNEFMSAWIPLAPPGTPLPRWASTQYVYLKMITHRWVGECDVALEILTEAGISDTGLRSVPRIRKEKIVLDLVNKARARMLTDAFRAEAVKYIEREIEREEVVFGCMQPTP